LARCLQELKELVSQLRELKPAHEGPYTFQQEYEDFRLTFSSLHGQRVLALIMDMTTPAPVVPGMVNSEYLWFAEGQRSIQSQILLRLSGERVRPKETPEPDYDPRDHT
jgi:hypothetical protein